MNRNENHLLHVTRPNYVKRNRIL